MCHSDLLLGAGGKKCVVEVGVGVGWVFRMFLLSGRLWVR